MRVPLQWRAKFLGWENQFGILSIREGTSNRTKVNSVLLEEKDRILKPIYIRGWFSGGKMSEIGL
jgi:hypothetical protein